MSLYTELNTIVDQVTAKEANDHAIFLNQAGFYDIKTFLSSFAKRGLKEAMLHIEKGPNPKHKNNGYATLSGQLAISNSEPSRGIIVRNDVGWFYFNMPTSSEDQFAFEVHNIGDYLEAQGLTIQKAIGYDMAEIAISWA